MCPPVHLKVRIKGRKANRSEKAARTEDDRAKEEVHLVSGVDDVQMQMVDA